MVIYLYINGIKRKFTFGIGWFRGVEFALLDLQILQQNDRWWTILHLQIAKFVVDILLDEVEPR